MSLQDKYASLIDAAKAEGATNLQVREQNNVLYIDGEVPTGAAKDKLWNVYNGIDPDFRSGDLVLDVKATGAQGQQLTVSTKSSNLNVRKGPGTDTEILGKAAHGATVTLLSDYNDSWSLIRTADGVEGYCSKQYLTGA